MFLRVIMHGLEKSDHRGVDSQQGCAAMPPGSFPRHVARPPPIFPLEFAVIRMSVISPFNGDGTKKERRGLILMARDPRSRSLASSNLGPAESFIYALRIRNRRRRRALEFMKLLSRRAGVLPLCSLPCDPPILRPPLLSQSRPP